MQPQGRHIYEFGPFRLDEGQRRLLKDDRPVALEPKVFDTLLTLVENKGRLVFKEEIMSRVWPDSFVEEVNLNRSISTLRKALGERASHPAYIETVPKRGYRFAANVVEVFDDEADLILEKRTSAEIVVEEEEEILVSDSFGREAIQAASIPQSRFIPRMRRQTVTLLAALGVALAVSTGYFWATRNLSRDANGSAVRSIAVLPFKSLGAISDDEHLGLGVADVLITRLSNLKAVNVRPTSAVLKYDQGEQDSTETGKALGVEAVLEGSIQREGDRIRVTARLVRVSDRSPIWAAQFDEEAKDLLAVQDRISEQVADSVAMNLSGSEKAALTKRYTENVDAYRLYTKGRYHWNKRNWEGMIQAQYFFRQAIEKDPTFALAHVGLADTLLTNTGGPEAFGAINKALELDAMLGEAYAARGFASMFHEWDWHKAEENFKRAIELSPGYGTAHQWYATLLAIEGRPVEAKLEMRRALEIDPLSHNFLADLGQMHYFAREYQEAEGYCRKALEVSPDFMFAHQYLFDVYVKTGRHDEAVEAFLKANKANSSFSRYASERQAASETLYGEAYPQSGIKRLLRYIVDMRLRGPDPNGRYQLAKSYALLGEKEQALDWLEKSLENRDFLLPFVNADPIFDELRTEPRYQAVVHRMGLGW